MIHQIVDQHRDAIKRPGKMNETIIKDIEWTEDWGGYSAPIHQLNENTWPETLKIFIQTPDAPSWKEIPLIPEVSAEGYAYSWVNGLRIFYLGNDKPKNTLVKIDF